MPPPKRRLTARRYIPEDRTLAITAVGTSKSFRPTPCLVVISLPALRIEDREAITERTLWNCFDMHIFHNWIEFSLVVLGAFVFLSSPLRYILVDSRMSLSLSVSCLIPGFKS
jgi:hypothetical protein